MAIQRKHLVLLVVLGLGLIAKADDSRNPDVLLGQSQTFGQYLTNYKGWPVYMFAKDSQGLSTCYDQCAQNWPAIVFEDKSAPVAGPGLDEKLIGYAKRKDGTAQVTYAGWPLYGYMKDQKATDFAGQGVGGNWFLVSPKGEIIKKVVAQAQQAATNTQAQNQQAQATPAQTDELKKLVGEGKAVFVQYCAACHGSEGKGGAGPNLVGISVLKNISFVAGQVIGGGEQMPGFGSVLNDHQVSAVATFVRNSWGNNFGILSEADAKAKR